MQVAIAGAGVAGLTAALALARQGHRVQVLDRDATPRPGDLTSPETWHPRGVAHVPQPHAVLARVHAELADALAQRGFSSLREAVGYAHR